MAKEKAALTCAVVLFNIAASLAYVEDLDDKFKDGRMNDAWLVKFYAPWCGYCKKLEPVWHDIGAELKSSGSVINVGRMDATAYSSVASEFGVRGYPTIKLIKGDLAYNYRGPRTKDDIIEFANRVAGEPVVRPLPSQQMFEHVVTHHSVVFVYIGGESPLKEKYIEVASELIVYTYFFLASEDALPKTVTLHEIPTVAVFKDGSYFLYDETGKRVGWGVWGGVLTGQPIRAPRHAPVLAAALVSASVSPRSLPSAPPGPPPEYLYPEAFWDMAAVPDPLP
ncbi:hypothetical protein ANANG_G00170880 [Anguilla anguilla]|uniref:protein disulfide-isomerase n=1 Tax=Anguilla anguilla TaxID=7936 RepID=A0A9D3MA59_ANGAN|nr:hypothetical protein ANANG_G00170880 [Anguilla anguilla]